MLTARTRAAILALLALAAAGCARRTAEAPAFCYRWLTDVTCYLEPVPGAAHRLAGGYYFDPDDPSTRAYWLRRARASMSR